MGTAAKIAGSGKTYDFGWTSTGGTLAVYYTTNGISQNVTGPITYTVETGAHVKKPHSLKPISSLFK
jgi:hypothetical protein